MPRRQTGNLRDFEKARPGFEKMQQNALGRTYSMNAFRSWNGMPNNRKEAFAGIAYIEAETLESVALYLVTISR